MSNGCYSHSGMDCYGGSPIAVSVPPPVANLPIFTDRYTPRDACQFIKLEAGAAGIAIPIPLDPNTNDRAKWVGFSSMDGDYIVSMTGNQIPGTLGTDSPLFNPEKLPLDGVFNLYIWSKHGCTVRVCWYRHEPCNQVISESGDGLTTLIELLLKQIQLSSVPESTREPIVKERGGTYTIPAGARYISIASNDQSSFKVAGQEINPDIIVTFPYLPNTTYNALTVEGNLLIQEVR